MTLKSYTNYLRKLYYIIVAFHAVFFSSYSLKNELVISYLLFIYNKLRKSLTRNC